MCGVARGRQVEFVKFKVPVKRHRGEPGHTRDTRDTRAHAGTRITQTNLTTIQTQRHTRTTSTRRPKPRPTQQPQEEPQAPVLSRVCLFTGTVHVVSSWCTTGVHGAKSDLQNPSYFHPRSTMTGNKPSMAHGRTPQAAGKGLKVLPGVAGWGVWCAGRPPRGFLVLVVSSVFRRLFDCGLRDETPKRLDAEIRGRGAARRGSGATRPQPVTTASNGSALPPTTSSQEVYIPSRVRYKTSPDYQLLIELLRTSNARTSGAAAAANLGPVPPRIKTPSSASRQPPRRRSC